MPRDPRAYLWDARKAEHAVEFVTGKSFEEFQPPGLHPGGVRT